MVKTKGRIVYVGPMSFPNGGAAARRILGNALSFISAGYEVLIGSGQMPETEFNEDIIFEGIVVHSIGERTAEDKPILIKHLSYTGMGKKTINWLSQLDIKPKAIILYSGDLPYLLRLMPWCKKNHIPLIYEACEWFDPANIPGGRYSPYRLNHEITMRYLVSRVKNVLAISSFLTDHYKNLGCLTVCVPPTIDTLHFKSSPKNRSSQLISIAYTGSPGKKDLFNKCLEALLQLDPKGDRFRFNVAGLSDDEILSYPALEKYKMNGLPTLINNIGSVSHSEALNLVGNSDFSILLRYPKRYAHAGFPTKVVESMVMGTPVICNLTSDLHKYIQDGISGIVCEDYKVESLIKALIRVEKMSTQEMLIMSRSARTVAEVSFDYRSYVSALDDFIQRTKTL
jgi:glycosyltransferase involved in cell wall biosynthesis